MIDLEATSTRVRDGFQWLVGVAKPEDVAILFVSSHGLLDRSGEYFIGTHEVDPEHLLATGISAEEFVRQVAKLPCKVLVFLDTCHSGSLGSKIIDDPMRELVSDEVGAILFASSKPREDSLEHGAGVTAPSPRRFSTPSASRAATSMPMESFRSSSSIFRSIAASRRSPGAGSTPQRSDPRGFPIS